MRPPNANMGPLQAAFYWVAGITLTIAAVVIGAFVFGTLLIILATAGLIIGGRVWWQMRKWRKQLDSATEAMAGSEPEARATPQRDDDLTADYEVVERRSDQR